MPLRSRRKQKQSAPPKKVGKKKEPTEKSAYHIPDEEGDNFDLLGVKTYSKGDIKISVLRSGSKIVRFELSHGGPSGSWFATMKFATDNKNLKQRVMDFMEWLATKQPDLEKVCDIYDGKNDTTTKERKKATSRLRKKINAKGDSDEAK